MAFVALALAMFAAVDQLPIRADPQVVAQNAALVAADRSLATQMETALPRGSMVFQMPPMHFPEVGPVSGVDSYEQFRPYFFTRTLRYSHGEVKGRDSELKFELAKLQPEDLLRSLHELGFRALYVNRGGYDTAQVEQLLQAARRFAVQPPFVLEGGDVVVVEIVPKSRG